MANSRTPPTQTYRTPDISNVEDLEGYAPGGYCPVNIGDAISSSPKTYTILHKLGFGPSSTVWLARLDDSKASFHALKILRADLSGSGKHPELEVLQRLELEGRKNHHQCLVHIQHWFTALVHCNQCQRPAPLLRPPTFGPQPRRPTGFECDGW
jgi:hypothetical protein